MINEHQRLKPALAGIGCSVAALWLPVMSTLARFEEHVLSCNIYGCTSEEHSEVSDDEACRLQG